MIPFTAGAQPCGKEPTYSCPAFQREQSFLIGSLDRAPAPRAFAFLSVATSSVRYGKIRNHVNLITGQGREQSPASVRKEGARCRGRDALDAAEPARAHPRPPPNLERPRLRKDLARSRVRPAGTPLHTSRTAAASPPLAWRWSVLPAALSVTV